MKMILCTTNLQGNLFFLTKIKNILLSFHLMSLFQLELVKVT